MTDKLREAFDRIILTPVIYDEVTNFKNVSSYPFEKRKNVFPAFDIPDDIPLYSDPK